MRAVLVLVMMLVGGGGTIAHAHVGNKDVYETVTVGGYKLFVIIRTPLVIPGVATIEVRSSGAAIDSITITPLLLTGEASKHPPTPDALKRSGEDAAFFTGSLWLMGGGSYQVRFAISGAAGAVTASVPVSAAPLAVLKMQRPLGILLGVLGVILVVGLVGIVAGATRESRLKPGVQPDAARQRRAKIAGVAALVFALVSVGLGGYWWNVEAAEYAGDIYRASDLRTTLTGDKLDLVIGDPDPKAEGGWKPLANKDLLPDHGHLMHLYAIREPEMDAVYHLHPVSVGKAGMSLTLPSMPPGTYKLYADIVYFSGFPETETAELTVPAGFRGGALGAEDASAAPLGISAGELGAVYKLPDGYSMVWQKPAVIRAETPYAFRFTLLDKSGKPAGDMQPYLGMAGHAAFVKDDGTTFAHTHPDGSAAMAAVMLADASTNAAAGMGGMDMGGEAEAVSPSVEFPYGFPSAGRYRVFVQMKHGGVVETGVFDAEVRSVSP